MTYYKNTHLSGWYTFNKIEQAAEGLRKRDRTLTKEQAVAKAVEQRPELAEAYRVEFRKDLQR